MYVYIEMVCFLIPMFHVPIADCAIVYGSKSTGYYTGAFVVFNLTDPESGQIEILGSEDPHEEIGKYGSHSPIKNISGFVVHAARQSRSNYGCWKPYENVQVASMWIALIQRGNCTFAEKIHEATLANASGVIVYAKTNEVDVMGHEGADTIVSVMIPKDIGEEVTKRVDGGEKISVTIRQGSEHWSSVKDKTSIIFVSLSFLILMVISLTWLIVYYVQRFRLVQTPDALKQRRALVRKLVHAIPNKTLKEDDKEIENEEVCSICIENYEVNDTLRILPCKHMFHRGCVDKWLGLRETCPMCKFDVLKSYGLCPLPLGDVGIIYRRNVTPVLDVRQQGQQNNFSVPSTNSMDSLVGNAREETIMVSVSDTTGESTSVQATTPEMADTQTMQVHYHSAF